MGAKDALAAQKLRSLLRRLDKEKGGRRGEEGDKTGGFNTVGWKKR